MLVAALAATATMTVLLLEAPSRPATERDSPSAERSEPSAPSIFQVDSTRDGLVIGASAVAAVVQYLFADQLITPRCPCDPDEVNAFDRPVIGNDSHPAEVASDVTLALTLTVPLLLDGLDLGLSRPFYEDAVVFVEALAIDAALFSLVKAAVHRPLSIVYSGQAPSLVDSPRGYRSFYSGHAALAFAALSVTSVTLDLRYDAGVWPWLASAAIGASVAIERVAAGRHFYTDVLVGFGVGTLVGTVVPLLHLRPREAGVSSPRLVPAPGGLAIVGVL
jgi:membrane-associated phospholipid phosphatase